MEKTLTAQEMAEHWLGNPDLGRFAELLLETWPQMSRDEKDELCNILHIPQADRERIRGELPEDPRA